MTTLKTFVVIFISVSFFRLWVSWVLGPHLIPGPSVSSTGLGCELNKPVRWLRLYIVFFLARLIPFKSMMGELLKSSRTGQRNQGLMCISFQGLERRFFIFIFFLFFFCLFSLVAQSVKNPPAVQETWVPSLDREDPLEKEMATHSSILAWKISWTWEPGGLKSMVLQSQARLSN